MIYFHRSAVDECQQVSCCVADFSVFPPLTVDCLCVRVALRVGAAFQQFVLFLLLLSFW